jgi:hypothetical protein
MNTSYDPLKMEYSTYKATLAAHGVFAIPSFEAWAESVNKHRNGHEVVFEVTNPKVELKPGWYKNVFPPNEREPDTYGPYKTRAEAVAA